MTTEIETKHTAELVQGLTRECSIARQTLELLEVGGYVDPSKVEQARQIVVRANQTASPATTPPAQ